MAGPRRYRSGFCTERFTPRRNRPSGLCCNGRDMTHSLRCGLQICRWLRQLVDREVQLAQFESRAIIEGAIQQLAFE